MIKLGFRKTLSDILANADPDAEKLERIFWLEELIDWIRLPINPSGNSQFKQPQHIQSARIKFLLQLLERNPEWKKNVSLLIQSILIDMSPMTLLVETGLPGETGFLEELITRIFKKFLHFNGTSQDLNDLILKIFTNEQDAQWIQSLDPITLSELRKICFYDSSMQQNFASNFIKSLKSSLIVLSAQMESIVFSSKLRGFLQLEHLEQSTFWKYRILTNEFIKTIENFNSTPEEELKLYSDLKAQIQSCRFEVQRILSSFDENGLTVRVVYKIESLESYLDRSEKIIEILSQRIADQNSTPWQDFLGSLIRDSIESYYLIPFIRNHLHLISRAIVERASQSGEHYITRNNEEYKEMAKSAIGGGVLTSVTALIKFIIAKTGFAPFFEGLLYGLNYTFSFVLIQQLHFTLATKQPAMTAPALASKLKQTKNRNQIPEFLEEIANLVRGQFIAVVGNLASVIPAALIIQIIWTLTTSRRILSPEYALKTLSSHNPLTSLTTLYAFETGIILFISSLLSGYFENWCTYHKIVTRILNHHILKSILSQKQIQSVSNWINRNLSALIGSVILGLLLGFTPIVGYFFGLPLDVRHVTLSAGALAIAASSFTLENLPILHFIGASVGILIIGLFNFTVSFSLALFVAVISQNIKKAWFLEVIKLSFKAIRLNPRYFLFPSKSDIAKPRFSDD